MTKSKARKRPVSSNNVYCFYQPILPRRSKNTISSQLRRFRNSSATSFIDNPSLARVLLPVCAARLLIDAVARLKYVPQVKKEYEALLLVAKVALELPKADGLLSWLDHCRLRLIKRQPEPRELLITRSAYETMNLKDV